MSEALSDRLYRFWPYLQFSLQFDSKLVLCRWPRTRRRSSRNTCCEKKKKKNGSALSNTQKNKFTNSSKGRFTVGSESKLGLSNRRWFGQPKKSKRRIV